MTRHQIYISVGSNINQHVHICAGLDEMKKAFGDLTLSRIYESESVGFDGDNFYNFVVGAKTDDDIASVVASLKRIEDSQGRDRTSERFSSRTLDLDLLLFDDVVCKKPITLPRDEISDNAFVLLPLAEVAPNKAHPVTQQTYATMWQEFDKAKQTLWMIDFDWNGTAL
jgi:2-amino-4-hydroxy-6-hydroxymethyldihydropteridine diphosphokinase